MQPIPILPSAQLDFFAALDLALKLGLHLDVAESCVPCAREWLAMWAAEHDLVVIRKTVRHDLGETPLVEVSHGRFSAIALGPSAHAREPRVQIDQEAMWRP